MCHGPHAHRLRKAPLALEGKLFARRTFSSGGSSTVLDGETSIDCVVALGRKWMKPQRMPQPIGGLTVLPGRKARASQGQPGPARARGCLGFSGETFPAYEKGHARLAIPAAFITRKCLRRVCEVCLSYLLEQSVTWIEPESDEDDFHSPKAGGVSAQGFELRVASTIEQLAFWNIRTGTSCHPSLPLDLRGFASEAPG